MKLLLLVLSFTAATDSVLLEKSQLGGRTLDELLGVALKVLANTVRYYLNGGNFESPIEDLVTIYCRNSSTILTKVSVETISTVTTPTLGFVFIVHGWTDSYRAYFVDELIEAHYTHLGEMNICAVDYQPISLTELFTITGPRSFDVATVVSGFIRAVSQTYGVPFSQFTFIGHSLGAHISGIVGNNVGGELGAIYAADPCGNGCVQFYNRPASESLTRASAKYVQTIASNKYGIGSLPAYYRGHQVFWPNDGGPNQPGCSNTICSHYRALDFLISSFDRRNVFGARKCSNEIDLWLGLCSGNPCDQLGPHAKRSQTGNFYLYTRPDPPYAANVACPYRF